MERETFNILFYFFFCLLLFFFSFFVIRRNLDTHFRPDLLPDRIFRASIHVIEGDEWTLPLADQSSLRFQHKSQFYRDGIDAIIQRSDLRDSFEGSEILALDG